MRNVNSTAYDIVSNLGEKVSNLQVDTKLGIYTTPYTEKPLETFNEDLSGLVMYGAEDIAFLNTKQLTKVGQEYLRTGKYTQAHPKFDSKEYNAFWDEQERLCKEGMIIPGKLIKNLQGEYRLQEIHITGEHYGYLNFGEIKRSKEFEIKSGAILDGKGEVIKKVDSGTAPKSFFLPDFWDGDYYFFKARELCKRIGRHLVIGKARRKGYSYKNGWILANNANLYRRSTSVVGAYDAASLFDDGTMNKVMNYLDFICKHTDWDKGRIHNTLEHLEIGYRYQGDQIKRGFLSNIYTAILKTSPGGMRGKDADELMLEEAGKCPNLSEVLDATLKTLTDGEFMTGLFTVFGTGGGDDINWQGFEDLFYEAYARKFVMFENVWDIDMLGTGCGYFHGSFMSRPGLIDIHGNSDVKGSIKAVEAEKALVKHDAGKLNALEMEEPDKPSQAFSRTSNNIFPSIEINEQLRRVLRDPNLQGLGREGLFVRSKSKGIKFIDRLSATDIEKELIPPAITNYPVKAEDDLRGCWVLWELPYRDSVTGFIPENLYSAWNDPYGISKEKEYYSAKDSLGVTWLYENANNFTPTKGDIIIGCFVGRREDTEEYDDQMFLGIQYFNGKLLYENDRGDVYTNAKKRGLLELLKDEPEFQYQKNLQKGGGGRKKGISIAGNSNRKLNGVVYLKNWLLQIRGTDEKGNKLLNLHYIYDVGFLRELLKYDGKRNADRVSTGIIGMFDIRESLNKQIVPEESRNAYTEEDDDYFNNPFNR